MPLVSSKITSRKSSGFSLLELVAAMAVVLFLGCISLEVWNSVKERQNTARVTVELSVLRASLEEYRLVFGSYPIVSVGEGENGAVRLFQSLMGRLGPCGEVVVGGRKLINPSNFSLNEDGDQLVDVWGSPIFYCYQDTWEYQGYFLLSLGKDLKATFPDEDGCYDPKDHFNTDNCYGAGGR